MKKVLIMPALAALLLATACGGDGGSTGPDGPASVRFFNATDMAGSGAFTANGAFTSALAFGQSAQTCSEVEPGSASFAFGAANAGGTGLSGDALATLNNQTIAAGGNYTLVATGSAASPQLYLLDHNSSGSPGASQAAVRFVNLAPGPNPLPNVIYVFTGGLPPSGTVFAGSLIVGAPSPFKSVTSGSNTFTAIIGHQLATSIDATFDLQGGSVNTIAIVQETTSDPLQMITLPRC